MLERTGVPIAEQINSVFPSEERLAKGPVAIIECYQNIPCNPCFTACNRNAIKEFQDINDLPEINHDQCNGCGLCIAKCPGLAIMVLDAAYSEDEVLIKIPYEFTPLPKEGQTAKGLDREGRYVCDVTVVKVLNSRALDRTPIVSIAVPRGYLKAVRNFGM
ncbi:MAG: 4Fe-4S binding protein [Bacillota bacterium]